MLRHLKYSLYTMILSLFKIINCQVFRSISYILNYNNFVKILSYTYQIFATNWNQQNFGSMWIKSIPFDDFGFVFAIRVLYNWPYGRTLLLSPMESRHVSRSTGWSQLDICSWGPPVLNNGIIGSLYIGYLYSLKWPGVSYDWRLYGPHINWHCVPISYGVMTRSLSLGL